MSNSNKLMLLTTLTIMCALGLISTDIYIPALPFMAEDLKVKGSMLQLSLSTYCLGLAVAQLIYGPLSESFGRKPIVIIGVTIFILSSFTIMLAPNIDILLFARMFQAIGAAAGQTIGRAIISEFYTKEEMGKIFATIFPFIGLSPAIAPMIGGCINYYLGWRAIFFFIGMLGILLILLIYFKLPETRSKDVRSAINLKIIGKNYLKLLANKTFWKYALAPCVAYIAYFAYLAETPFLFAKYNFNTQAIGFFYIHLSVSYILGNLTAHRLLSKFNLPQVLLWGYYCFMIGGISMVIFNYNFSKEMLVLNLLIPSAVLTFGNGFLIPLGSAGVMSSFPQKAGLASGLLGFVQLSAASISTSWIGYITKGDTLNLSLYIAISTILGYIAYILLAPSPVRTNT